MGDCDQNIHMPFQTGQRIISGLADGLKMRASGLAIVIKISTSVKHSEGFMENSLTRKEDRFVVYALACEASTLKRTQRTYRSPSLMIP